MYTLHLVSHTHWDREWYLTFQQFRLKLVRLVDELLDILEHDPHYAHFMLDGQTIALEDYLAIRPEREAELRAHIQGGRITIGPWYILPDEFLVSPEATIRNLLEGRRGCERFGPRMRVGYLPDTFGHIGQMPQILRGFGFAEASAMRGLGDEPCEFWWQAPDGSRVMMAYLRDSYSNGSNLFGGPPESFPGELARLRDSLAAHSPARDLLIMHGTDHLFANARTSQAVAYANQHMAPDRVLHSTLEAYLAAVRTQLPLDDLPVVCGELRDSRRQPLLPGVLSSRMWIKQRNAACEHLLEAWAEPFSALASASATATASATASASNLEARSPLVRRPADVLRQAWRLLMECHPHDSICGCSIDPVHEEMRSRFDQVEQIGEEITRQSLETLAEVVDTQPSPAVPAARAALVVFNASDGPQTGLVSTILEQLPEHSAFALVDADGQELPFQTLGSGSSQLINVTMDRKTFRESFNTVANGVLMGWRMQQVEIRRAGKQVDVRVVLSESRPPNLAEWERGRAEISALLEDHEISHYSLLATSTEALRVRFLAPQVPGRGYRTVWVVPKPAEPPVAVQLSPLARAALPLLARISAHPGGQRLLARLTPDPARKPPYRIQNEFFQVEAAADGTLTVTDRRTGAVFNGLNRFFEHGERGDSYNFSAVPGERDTPARLLGVRVERGPLCQTLELSLLLESPAGLAADRKSRSGRVKNTITSRVSLAQGVARIDIDTEIDNQAADHRVQVAFPVPFKARTAAHDGHFELVRRPVAVPQGDPAWTEQPYPEVPQRAFSALSDGRLGLLLANRGLPEISARPLENGHTELVLTLLRCFGWLSREDYPERKGHAGPFLATPGGQMPGKWRFSYALAPYADGPEAPGGFQAACQQARAFQSEMRAVIANLHPGRWPASAALLEVAPGSFTVTAVKQAEDGRGWLVRGVNLSERTVQAALKPLLPFSAAHHSSLDEELGPVLPTEADGSLSLPVGPHQIVTIRLLPEPGSRG